MTSVGDVERVEILEAPRRAEVEVEGRRAKPILPTLGKVGGGLALLAGAALLGRASRRRFRARRSVGEVVGDAMGDLGRGFLAGMAGTLAITTASTTDALVTEAIRARREKRKPSLSLINAIVNPWSFSAGVVGKVFGIVPTDPAHERRLGVMAHWEYGSTWGLSLPLFRAVGLHGLPAMGTLLAGQLTAEMVVMPAFKLFPPPTQWGKQAIVSSVYQHAIYAVAAVSAYEWLRARG